VILRNLNILLISFFVLFFSAAIFAASPTVTSDSHPNGEWSREQFIYVDVSFSGAEKFVYLVNREPETIPVVGEDGVVQVDVGDGSIYLGTKLDGEYFLHILAKTSSGLSDTTHYSIKIDRSGPSRPQDPIAEALEDGNIKVEWTAADDELSGVSHYDVYRSVLRFVKDGEISREFSIRDDVAKLVGSGIMETSFLDTNNIGEGYRYHYKLVAYDTAGNQGIISSAASVEAKSFCDLVLDLNSAVVDNNLVIGVNSSLRFKKGFLSISGPDKKEVVLVDSISNVSDFTAGFDLIGKVNGDYNIFFNSLDDDQDECPVYYHYYYDTVNPTVRFIAPNTSETLSDSMRFVVDAKDSGDNPSGLVSVSLFVENEDFVKIGDFTEEGDRFVYDWNTINFDNGRFKLVVRAVDGVGNVAEDSELYNIKNTFFDNVASKNAIAEAEAKKVAAVSVIESLEKLNVNVSSLSGIMNQADSNLSYAKEIYAGSVHFSLAEKTANSAKNLYEKARTKISVADYKSAPYIYNVNQLDVFLSASGLDSSLAAEAKELILKHQPSRKLSIVKVTDSGVSKYFANIEITLVNPDSNAVELKVLEVIPKKFTDAASQLSSYDSFEILQADPVIIFDSVSVPSGSKKIIYSLNVELSQAQADALITSNVMSFYVAPPVVLSNSADVSSIALSSLLNFTSLLSVLPPIEWNTTTIAIVVIAFFLLLFIMFLLLVVVVFSVYFFFIKKKKRWQ